MCSWIDLKNFLLTGMGFHALAKHLYYHLNCLRFVQRTDFFPNTTFDWSTKYFVNFKACAESWS